MSRRYFGTDGVRGEVGADPLTPEFAMRLACATAHVLGLAGSAVLIGQDTRESGDMFTAAMQAGFLASGVDVRLAGVVPTPAVSYLVRELGCTLGVVISASHNPYRDNGIKYFNADGGKLDDDTELLIEAALDQPVGTIDYRKLGNVARVQDALERYRAFCASILPEGTDLSHLRIVVDCAHGATYDVAPQVFAGMGMKDVIAIGAAPDGRNINDGCGSTSPELLRRTVLDEKADLGIGFDGDGDRVLMVDAAGTVIDGDQLLYLLACHRKAKGTLTGPVVGTVMSNMGLDEALAERGIGFLRAKVGDRYVLEMLADRNAVLGGENSGHLLCLDLAPTGDAMIAAALVLGILGETGSTLAELVAPMPKYTQVLRSVRVPAWFDLTNEPSVQTVHQQAAAQLADNGRIVLRASGTEPVVRVMVESRDPDQAEELTCRLVEALTAATGG